MNHSRPRTVRGARRRLRLGGEEGHLMAGLLAAIMIMLIFSTMVFQSWSDLLHRENEEEMMFRARQLAHGLIGSLVWIAVGAALWKGLNWGRWLAILWAVTALLLTLAAAGFGLSLLLKAPAFAAMCFFLVNRRAAAYFGGEERTA